MEEKELVGLKIRVADTFFSRLLGLMGRVPEPDTGLLLTSCCWVHTCFMLVPIDVVFLDAEGRVLKIVENLKPWSVSGPIKKARAVLELGAGEAAKRGIKEGDRLEVFGKKRHNILNISCFGQGMKLEDKKPRF